MAKAENVAKTISFNVLNRFLGSVQFTAQIKCADDALPSVKMGLAVKWAIESGAYLSGADLSRADLSGAYLSGADLSRANLSGAENGDLSIAQTRILPDGDLIGWKKCSDEVVVKLRIPTEAKRSHAFGRKCRASFVEVLEVIGAEIGISRHDGKTEYRVGERVTPDAFDENWQDECSSGIHFFITREEAEAY